MSQPVVSYYCLQACVACDTFHAAQFAAGRDAAEKAGKLWRVSPLTSTETMQHFAHNVKPHLKKGYQLPLWYDEQQNKEFEWKQQSNTTIKSTKN